jgi:putative ABC transport system permease protein
MISSLRIALRALLKSPGFTLVSLITLALGIGVNTGMFSLVNALLYRSAPFPAPEQLVRIWDVSAQSQNGSFSVQDLEEMRAQATCFSSLTSWTWWVNTLAEPGQPAEQLSSMNSTPEFFETFGVKPLLGRPFTAEEEVVGRNQVALLSHEFWQKRFGGNPSILGKTIRLSTEPVTIIGVMPPGFGYPMLWGRVDFWRPIALPRHLVDRRESRQFNAIARLKPGVTPAQAEAQLAPLAARLAKDHPELNQGHSFHVQPLEESLMNRNGRAFSWMLLGLSAFVLLIACANLANLQLARAASNARELAIRAALGASRARLIVHQLVECLILSLGGAALGLLVATWITKTLEKNIIITDGVTLSLPIDGKILSITLVVALCTGLLFGLIPALLASRVDINAALKQQGRGSTTGRAHHRLRHALIISEVALSLVLLAGAGVMVRGFNKYLGLDHGWDTQHILTATIHPPEETRYSGDDTRRDLHRKLEQRLAAIPGVEYAAMATSLPIGFYTSTRPIEVAGQTSTIPNEQPPAAFTMVTKDYFSALGIPLIEGRSFSPDVRADSPQVVVINETLAQHFWPHQSALGQRIGSLDGKATVWREVIGVVRDVDFAGNVGDPGTRYQIYRPLVQEPWGYLNLILRSRSPQALKRELKRAMVDVDPDVAIEQIDTVPEAIDRMQHNFFVIQGALEAFALLGLVLAAVGLYGVISNLVAQRTSEFGIRLALGARPSDILRSVLVRGIKLSAIGIAIGLLGGIGIGKFLASLMPRISAVDLTGLVGMSALLFIVALIASWMPARRATQVDPLVALRAE